MALPRTWTTHHTVFGKVIPGPWMWWLAIPERDPGPRPDAGGRHPVD